MKANHYRQGPWLYVLRNGIAVVVAPETAPDAIRELWELLGRNPSVDQLLNEVTRSFGTSVTGLPDFAVVDHRGPLRLFLRGPLRVTVLDGDGTVVDGRGVTTWNERTLPASGNFEIGAVEAGAPGAGGGTDDAAWLPLESGVVLASRLVVGELPEAGRPEAEAEASADEDSVTADLPLFAAAAPVAGTSAGAAVEATEENAPSPEEPAEEDDAAGSAPEGLTSLEGTTDSLATELLGAREPAMAADAPEEPAEEQEPGDAVAPVQEAPNDLTTTYDHLWDRVPVTGDEQPADGPRPEEDEPPAEPAPTSGNPADREEADREEAERPAEEEPRPEPSAPAAPPVDETAHTLLPEADESLIDEVPWLSPGASASSSARVPSAAQGGPGVAARLQVPPPVPHAAPPLPPAPPSYPPVPAQQQSGRPDPAAEDPDHDGHTVFRSEIPGLGQPAAPAAPVAAPSGDGPQVLARLCPRGHANPPTRSDCMGCGEAISGDALSVSRPPLGRLRLPNGDTVPLDRNVILGRQPSVSRVSGGNMPHLVQLDSPKRDISRSHAEIRLEGWNVVLSDLNSSNGTVLLREGQAPRRLGQSETALVLSGDVVELGDQVYISFEDLP